ncbi:hypothetical protein BDV96DRAFT_652537 [Lophiotrema nucula]|uniref:Uncharacterized protein n=1 Tax=Lophiotrema nucula TaxID=690887 RepID=A0A6A5YS81_9PLEO|nr:hypothetical protein BDV96DRAFT_652537 [Lophiotrema nucula]
MAVFSESNGTPTANGHGSSISNGNGISHRANSMPPSGDANAKTSTTSSRAECEFPIAIVGMSCRFAGDATSPSKLWDLCLNGKDAWSSIPNERFNLQDWYHENPTKAGRTNVKGGYFLKEDIGLWDANFFKFSQDMAAALDPQIRLLLEGLYEATEDAGIPIENLAGSDTSVFTGIFNRDYYEMSARDPDRLASSTQGVGAAMVSNRISHWFDLRGASMSIDTGCSAGMVALHQACRCIWAGDSHLSVVAGADALITPDQFIAMSSLGVLSPDGKCFAWDSRANGFGRGEGVSVLILKPLSDAVQDGDRVHAVIRASGINQDGKTPTIASPSMEAQVQLIEETYRRAGLDIRDTAYVEAHMTGTKVGDPIEAEALARTFGQSRHANDPIWVGSVKPNIGHTEPCSGIAAIIKTAFALRDGLIPPNLNYEIPNKAIPLDGWHLQVPTSLTQWPHCKLFRASVNNFGYGGTNAHVIMERAPVNTPRQATTSVNGYTNARTNITGKPNGYANGINGSTNGHSNGYTDSNTDEDTSDQVRVYIISAKDARAAKEMAERFASHIRQSAADGRPVHPRDLAHTLANRRSLLHWIIAVSATSLKELCNHWESPGTKAINAERKPAKRLGFVFNGQGAQWHAMGRELIEAYPLFGQRIREAGRILKEYGANWSLRDELMKNAASTRVSEADLSQPSTVAIQLCLVDLLQSWGIAPAAVTSHSSGEVAAAYAVGALSFKEALGVIYYRGELALKLQKLNIVRGGMAAVGLGVSDVKKYLDDIITAGTLTVGCINSPNSVTLSGDLDAIDEIVAKLDADGVFARKLKVPLAYHSPHMSHIAKEYTDKLEGVLDGKSKSRDGILFASSVTGGVVTSARVLSPSHWARNLTGAVLFEQAFESMCFGPHGMNVDMIVELGAHSTLAGPIRQILKRKNAELPYVSCLKRPTNAVTTMHEVVCELLARQYPVSLADVNLEHADTASFVPDLPTYPWNHKTRYWDESRLSKEWGHRKFPPHEILGSILPIGAGNKLTWRNFFRVSEMEWVREYQLAGQIMLPAATHITMAIEACRLLTDPSEANIRGYILRDIEFMDAVVIPEHAPVEVQLSLSKCNARELEHAGWYEFDICSLGESDLWVENCKGYVSAETGDAVRAATTRLQTIPFEDEYLLRPTDVQPGPWLNNLIDARADGSKAITRLRIPDLASKGPTCVLHPTTLNSIFQTTICCLPDPKAREGTVVPRQIKTMSIPENINCKSGHGLQAFTELIGESGPGLISNISVINSDDEVQASRSFLQMHGFLCEVVPPTKDAESPDSSPMCSRCTWELDILHDIPRTIKDSMAIPMPEDEIDELRKRVRASFYLIHDALSELGEQPDMSSGASLHKLFYNWMKDVVARAENGNLYPGSETWPKASKDLRQQVYSELDAIGGSDRLLFRLGSKLATILRGEVAAHELMREGDLLSQYFADTNAATMRIHKHAANIINLFAMKHAGAKVLEIGAGAGNATQTILEAFDARGKQEGLDGSLLGHYTFTDISQDPFATVREKLTRWEGMMDFKQLDIEQDPVKQGFEARSYDLIVAPTTLHATKSLHRTLSHVRKLLKPGGKLILCRSTRDRLDTQVVMRLLPERLLNEELGSKMNPSTSIEFWDKTLHGTGFTGVDFDIADCEEEMFTSASLVLSTAIDPEHVDGPISIVHLQDQAPSTSWLSQLCNQLQEKTGIAPTVEVLGEMSFQDKICILTAELAAPFLDGIGPENFEKMRRLLTQSRGVLWLSAGGIADSTEPSYAATQGLLRTLRLEDTSKRYIHLDFEPGEPWTEDNIRHIIHVLQQSFKPTVTVDGIDVEYCVKNTSLHVPRFITDKLQSHICAGNDFTPEPELQPFLQPGHPLVWEAPKSGMLSDHYFTDGLDLKEPLPDGMVEIEAKAFGLNFRDVLGALGQLDETFLAHECSAVIMRLGPNTEESGLKIGDRVCCFSLGRFASASRVPWTSVAKIHDMPFEWAAAIPVAYTMAYHSLFHVARVRKGEIVLVHAAAGGFGQAAVILAQYAGAHVIVTCSSAHKRNLLHRQYGIPLSHILSSRDVSFAPAVMSLTKGKGVDVVLNSLAGPLLKASWDCIARFGRFVEVGRMDMEAARRLDMTPFRRCAMYASVDMMQLLEHNTMMTREAFLEGIRICVERARIPISPITTNSISDIEKAMRLMQTGKHTGKLVLLPSPHCQVPVLAAKRPVSLSAANSTYMIVGGVTGIGTAITEWFMSQGAKNLLLVSRHASTHSLGSILQAKGESLGCKIHLRDCDIADEQSLINLFAECYDTLPPIHGIVNCAMVLNDTVFEHMKYEQWTNGIRTKINTTRNLHKHMPSDISFFVNLASALGSCGNTSQSNYTAGNAYQDALARHRNKLGLPAVSIDLCVVRKVGVVESRVDGGDGGILSRFAKMGFGEIEVDAVLRLLEDAIRNPIPASQTASQVIVGLTEHTADCLAKENIARDRRFETLRLATRRSPATSSSPSDADGKAALVRALSNPATSAPEAAVLLVKVLTLKLAEVFNLSLDEIDAGLPLVKYGVDSLVAVEIRNWLGSIVKGKVAVFDILQSPSLREFGVTLATKSGYISSLVV